MVKSFAFNCDANNLVKTLWLRTGPKWTERHRAAGAATAVAVDCARV